MSTIRQLDNLSQHELEQVVNFLLHHMSMDLRERLMFALPRQYNKIVGAEIMVVRRKSDEIAA